jgi:UTP--glucose-1-phosphate uridylyltransferase
MYLQKVALLKLNGGIGTSMGCKESKFLLKIDNKKNLMDLTMDKIDDLERDTVYGFR